METKAVFLGTSDTAMLGGKKFVRAWYCIGAKHVHHDRVFDSKGALENEKFEGHRFECQDTAHAKKKPTHMLDLETGQVRQLLEETAKVINLAERRKAVAAKNSALVMEAEHRWP